MCQNVSEFDFCKAFDKVPHRPLIDQLSNLGLDNHIIQWITSYLTERKQRVVLNGETSETACVLSGVPQGSGPSDICGWGYESPHFWRQSISSICRRYLTLSANFKSGRLVFSYALLQRDIDNIDSWVSGNYLLRYSDTFCSTLQYHFANVQSQKGQEYVHSYTRLLQN